MKIKYKFSRMGNSFLNSHLRTSKLMIMFKHSLLLPWNYYISRKHRLSWAWPLFHIRHLSSLLWQKRTLADASLFISWQTKHFEKKVISTQLYNQEGKNSRNRWKMSFLEFPYIQSTGCENLFLNYFAPFQENGWTLPTFFQKPAKAKHSFLLIRG